MMDEEYRRWRRRRDKLNEKDRIRRATDPDWAERQRQNSRVHRERHLEERRAYNREWMRRARRVGSLHDLSCPGPEDCTCRPILLVREEDVA